MAGTTRYFHHTCRQGITGTGAPRASGGGPVVTAGGLIFIGSGLEHIFQAYDKDTGKLLWEHTLDGNPKGIPAVYEVGGRQYVAFLATAAPGKPETQGFYVFSLPRAGPRGKK